MKKLLTATVLGGAIVGSLLGAGAANAETAGQENAIESAESYLEYSSFSKSGLIEQLEYEGFTSAQAQYGADTAYGS